MLHTKTHEIEFSFDPSNAAHHPLVRLVEELLRDSNTSSPLFTSSHARTILIIDTHQERAQQVSYLLASAGYHPFAVANALTGFRRFLEGAFVPLVVILGQEDTSNRFFLFRLFQQITQRYNWETPLIHLRPSSLTTSLQRTDPLSLPSHLLVSPSLPQIPFPASSPAQRTAPLPKAPITPLPLSYVQQTESKAAPPTQASSSASSISQPLQVLHPVPIINISTHEISGDRQNAPKISLEGLSIGRYQMQTLLGGGPLGSVYQTYDRLREQDVALKAVQINALPPDIGEGFTKEINFFQQEKDLLSVLSHPNILQPLNCGKSYISGSPFVYKTMPYCAEGSLATWLYQRGTSKLLSLQEVAFIIMQLANALQHAHEHHVVYQNFKPSNILIREQASSTQRLHLLLTDFGLGHNESYLIKTPEGFPYMAPECWNGHSSPASDQYGLAAFAYELLTGRTLFQGQSEQILRHLHTSMQPQPVSMFNPQVSSALDNVILRALAKKLEDRFDTVAYFAQAFQRYCK